MAAKETVGLKVDSELAEKFREIQKTYSSGQDFAVALLDSLVSAQTETDQASPVFQEKNRVKKALGDIDRIMGSFLELAANDKLKAQEDAQIKVTNAQGQVAGLKERVTGQAEALRTLEKEKADFLKQIEALQGQAESIQALKDAWEVERGNLTSRVAELDAEAKEVRTLKSQMADQEKIHADLQGKKLLTDQQLATAQSRIEDFKGQLADQKNLVAQAQTDCQTRVDALKADHSRAMEKADADLARTQADCQARVDTLKTDHCQAVEKADLGFNQLRADLQTSRDELGSERLRSKEKELEIQGLFASENGRLTARVEMLEAELADKKKLQEKVATLESAKSKKHKK
jgi:hypothetical protein